MVFAFLLNPFIGLMAPVNALFPGVWNPGIDGTDAFITILIAHVWNGIPFNFVILLAGLLDGTDWQPGMCEGGLLVARDEATIDAVASALSECNAAVEG